MTCLHAPLLAQTLPSLQLRSAAYASRRGNVRLLEALPDLCAAPQAESAATTAFEATPRASCESATAPDDASVGGLLAPCALALTVGATRPARSESWPIVTGPGLHVRFGAVAQTAPVAASSAAWNAASFPLQQLRSCTASQHRARRRELDGRQLTTLSLTVDRLSWSIAEVKVQPVQILAL